MSTEDNKATLRRIVEDFNKRDLAFVDEVFSPHFTLYTALTPELSSAKPTQSTAQRSVYEICFTEQVIRAPS